MEERSTGGEPGEGLGAREAQYQAWAERMKAKRAAAKARIRSDQQPPQAEPSPSAGYWSTDALFAESQRVADTAGQAEAGLTELLAVLDLRDGADPDQVGAAYRRLAKEHHPDRHATADAETRAFHEDRMREITLAYRALRRQLA